MLKGSDRKHLRGLAHHLKPVVQVGKQGVIENLITSVSQALDAHELIKVKFVDHKQEREELSREIANRTESELAGLVGNIAILYRQHSDAEKRKIRLPQRARLRGLIHEIHRRVCAFLAFDVLAAPDSAVLHVVGDEPVPMQALKRVLESGGHQVTLFEQKEFASVGCPKTRRHPDVRARRAGGICRETVDCLHA